MPIDELLRFKDLKRLGVLTSWPQLRHMQEQYDFPRGKMLGANTRAWPAAEVEKWLAERPDGPSPHVMKRAERSIAAKREREGMRARAHIEREPLLVSEKKKPRST